jgi:TctA family transporter
MFNTGLPTIEERSTGFLLGMLSPEQVRARFGENLIVLHLYNFVSSALSVLLSEPRSGVWAFVRAIRGDQVAPRHFIQIGASLFATGLVVAYVISRLRSGVRRPQTLADRHTVIFALMLAGNASPCVLVDNPMAHLRREADH